MVQSSITNRRNSFRVKVLAMLATVPSTPSSDVDHLKGHYRRVLKQWSDVNISTSGISFRSKWGYNCDDMLAMHIKPFIGETMAALAKVVRTDVTGDVVTVAARFIQLTPESERNLSTLVLECQRKEGVVSK